MALLNIAKHHYNIISIILTYLKYSEKRNLFFTNIQLQTLLTKHKTMKQFENIIKYQTLTFHFPRPFYHKQGYPTRNKHQNHITTIVNAGAIKIKCQTCHIFFYNPKHEKQFKTCNQHQLYKWHQDKMYITKIGRDKKGHNHTTKKYFQPNGTFRQLILCDNCYTFLYYHTSHKTVKDTCAHCYWKATCPQSLQTNQLKHTKI